jgi:hypothetical protein
MPQKWIPEHLSLLKARAVKTALILISRYEFNALIRSRGKLRLLNKKKLISYISVFSTVRNEPRTYCTLSRDSYTAKNTSAKARKSKIRHEIDFKKKRTRSGWGSNVWAIQRYQKTYLEISWDYPFEAGSNYFFDVSYTIYPRFLMGKL